LRKQSGFKPPRVLDRPLFADDDNPGQRNPDSEGRVWDRLAVAVLGSVTIVALLTFRDYGLSWDDYAHSEYGDLLLSYYTSGLQDRRALSWVNLYYYGGGFDLLAAAAAKVVALPQFATRRVAGAVIGVVGLFVTWRTARHVAGPLAGFVALTLLAVCPLYYGHMFMNPKDAPFAVAMAILLLGQVRALQEYPRLSIATGALLGAGAGLAFGSRIMGGFGALEFAAALGFILALRARQEGVARAASELTGFLVRLLPAMLLAYVVMALVWPWSALDPRNPFRAVEYFSRFFEKPWSELFAGSVVLVTEMPRTYVPTLFALKLPEVLLGLGLAGIAIAAWMIVQEQTPIRPRAALLLVLLAVLLPPMFAVVLRPAMYNGIRHFVFVVPPLVVLGGVAAARLHEAARGIRFLATVGILLFALGAALPLLEMVRLHPYEYTYFNSLSGGMRNARKRYMLDYWGLSLKQASDGLLATLAGRGERKPEGRPWKLAVCGPHRSPQVELGSDFATTWDPAGADFAMMLGEFYCRNFEAPVLVEIARDGVVYARVYDIRGHSYDTLLTLPGL
jgi:hypothetical protein